MVCNLCFILSCRPVPVLTSWRALRMSHHSHHHLHHSLTSTEPSSFGENLTPQDLHQMTQRTRPRQQVRVIGGSICSQINPFMNKCIATAGSVCVSVWLFVTFVNHVQTDHQADFVNRSTSLHLTSGGVVRISPTLTQLPEFINRHAIQCLLVI
jgi:hypothetical protein